MNLSPSAAATRTKILQTAFEEFYHTGFQGGSLNHIVSRAGITKGALFHHFRGKDELGYSVLEELIRPVVKARWIEPLSCSNDPVEDLKKILASYSVKDPGQLCQGCPLNNLAQEMSPLDEGFRARIQAIYDEWRTAISEAFARGRQCGTVRADVAPDRVGAFVVSALTGMVGTAKNAQSTELLESASQGLIDYLESLKP